MNAKNKLFWILSLALTALWWSYAFMSQDQKNISPEVFNQKKEVIKNHFSPFLSTIHRHQIKQALTGDVQMMADLIEEWQLDAEILEREKVPSIKKLDHSLYVRAHILKRYLLKEEECGDKKPLLLPQTYAAALYLLSISSVEHIAALPKEIRDLDFFPRETINAVQADINRYHSEKLFALHPTLAIVAPYSHPSIIQAFKTQQIPTVTLHTPSTIDEVQSQVRHIGAMAQCPLKAELLTIFLQAALISLDNRFHTLPKQGALHKVASLRFYDQYYFHLENSLHMHLLGLLDPTYFSLLQGSQALHKENVVLYNPDTLLITTANSPQLKTSILNDKILKQTSAFKQGHIYFLDAEIQESPTHFAILAYFDLMHALTRGALFSS